MPQNSLRIAVFSLLLLVLAALTITPLLIGRNVHTVAIANTIDRLPPELRAQLEIHENEFDSGWWRSNARFELEYLPLGGLPLDMRLDMQIQHGPLLFTPNGLALGLVYANIDPEFDSAEIREALRELPFVLPDMTFDLRVGLNGDMRVGMNIAPVSHADANGQLEFDGIEALLSAHRDQSAEFSLNMGALSAQEFNNSFQFSLDALEMHFTSAQINNLLATSSSTISMPAFRSTAPFPIEVLDVAVESRVQASSAGAERTDFYQRIQIGEIKSELPVTAFSWTSEIKEIRNDLLQQYYALLTGIQNEMNASGGIVTAGVTQAAEQVTLLLLQNQGVFNTALAGNVYAGDHTLDLHILWRGLPDLSAVSQLDLNAVIAAVDLTFDISLDLDAVLRSPLSDFIDTYVQEGYLQLENGLVLMRASISNNALTVNGEPIALDNLN